MSRPEDLRKVTEITLHSLIADESLKFRILQKAVSYEQNERSRQKKLIPLFCTVLAALLIAAVSLNSIKSLPASGPGDLNSFTAGGTNIATSIFPEDFRPDSVLTVEMENLGTISDPDQCTVLTKILLNQSVPSDDADPVQDGKLIVTTSEGESYVFMVRNPYLINGDNRRWSCPAFFREFNNMIK